MGMVTPQRVFNHISVDPNSSTLFCPHSQQVKHHIVLHLLKVNVQSHNIVAQHILFDTFRSLSYKCVMWSESIARYISSMLSSLQFLT